VTEPVPTPHAHPAHAAERSEADGDHLVEQIERLAHLRDTGMLTDDEFAAAKARLLG
jgi:hypothetical protein